MIIIYKGEIGVYVDLDMKVFTREISEVTMLKKRQKYHSSNRILGAKFDAFFNTMNPITVKGK